VIIRLYLQGLSPDLEYAITEPIPSFTSQSTNNILVEAEVSIAQLGYTSVTLTGETLMAAGLPIKFYALDDAVMFHLCVEG
jgi:hypothetical protein